MPKIYKKGNWWCFRITNTAGKREIIKSVSKDEAQKKLLNIASQLLSSVSETSTYRVTIDQAIEYWLKQKKGTIDPTSYTRYEGYTANFKEFLRVKHPNLKYVDQIEPDHIKGFMDYRHYEKGKATKTVNSERQALLGMFQTLIDGGKMSDKNPISKVKPFKWIKVQKRRVMPEEELYKFFEEAKKFTKKVFWYGLYMILYYTGMRRDEVRLLKQDYINLKTG